MIKYSSKQIIPLLICAIALSTCNFTVTNDAGIIALNKQMKKEAQRDLLLAFIQKQTIFQARQTAALFAGLICNAVLLGIAVSIMCDLSTIKQIIRSK